MRLRCNVAPLRAAHASALPLRQQASSRSRSAIILRSSSSSSAIFSGAPCSDAASTSPSASFSARLCGQGSGRRVSAATGNHPVSRCAAMDGANTDTQVSVAAVQSPPADIKFSKLKGVLFDIDGTLTNSDPLHFQAFQELLAESGFNGGDPIDEEYFRANISGRHNPEIAADLFPSWTEAQQTAFSEAKEQRFRDLVGTNLKRLPGLSEFMAWLDARGLRKGAVTNAPKANTHLMLGALGLETYFETLVLGEECTRAKPFADPYLEGLKKLGLDAQAALVVEDSPAGIKAAVAACIPVIGLTTGQSADTLKAAGACHVVSDFTGIMAMIDAEGKQ